VHVFANNTLIYVGVKDFGGYRALGCDVVFVTYLSTLEESAATISGHVEVE
jgi:hypothetical protein